MYYLESENTGNKVAEFDIFDKDYIKEKIIKYLGIFNTDTVLLYKISNDEKYVGDDILGFYENHPKTKIRPCRVITKGNKDYYKALS